MCVNILFAVVRLAEAQAKLQKNEVLAVYTRKYISI